MAGIHHQAQLFSIEVGSCKPFCLSWPGTVILPISASQVVWDNRCTTAPGYWLRWDHVNSLPAITSNHNLLNLILPNRHEVPGPD
jgi:hypothetical protein